MIALQIIYAAPWALALVFCCSEPCSAASPIAARVWRPSKAGFVYPELDAESNKPLADYLNSKENFGLALAGGGLRGAYLAHGIVRSFRNAGLLGKMRYMSVTSGSIFFGVAAQFQSQDSLDTFLGETIAPENCTPQELIAPRAGSYITRMRWPITQFPKNMSEPESVLLRRLNETVAGLDEDYISNFESLHALERGIISKIVHCFKHLCNCAVENLVPEGSLHEIWGLLTAHVMFHPFGLSSRNSNYCHDTELERVQSKLGKRAKIFTSQDVKNNMPFLVSQSVVMALRTGLNQHSDPLLSFPLEITAMYSGVPNPYLTSNSTKYESLGDVLVESVGFNSEALEPVPDAPKGEMKVKPRVNMLNAGALCTAAGAATSYVGAFQIRPWATTMPRCEISFVEKLLPHAWMWSPLTVDSHGIPVTSDMPVGDAGLYDDMGHLPLLKRKVNKMVIYDSSAVHDHQFGPEKSNLLEMVYLFAAFGQTDALPPGNPAGSPNPFSPINFTTVFEPSEFAKLWSKVKELHAAKKPIVIRDKFTVVDNPFFGIIGGWQVEIVWVLELPIDAWLQALPAKTREHLPTWFPNVLAAEPKNQFELSALSQYGSWLTETVVMKEVRAMLDGDEDQADDHIIV